MEKPLTVPDIPTNEAARLLALKNTALLDSPAEKRFDRITQLAARFFNLETCLISLVDEQRQWFKSKVGLDFCETQRDISFCGHTILQSGVLVITDASKDPRFSANPLVIGQPYIRFYAGVPIHESSGLPIGTLCILSSQVRTFSEEEKLALCQFAEMVEYEITKQDQQVLQQQLLLGSMRTASILATLPDMVFVVDRHFRFLECNEHPDLLKPQGDIIGHTIKDVLPNELGDKLMSNVKQAFSKKEVIYHNYSFKELGKSFEARYKQIDQNEMLIIIRNTTEQVLANAEMRRLSEVARQTTNGIMVTDKHGDVVWVNEAFTHMTGYSFKDILGQRPGRLLQGVDTDPSAQKTMRTAIHEQKSFNVDILNYTKDRTPFWVRIACNPLLNEEGELDGFIAIETDITKEKQHEAMIHDNEKLLKTVIDANRIGTWHFNIQTNELLINDIWATLLGYSASELIPANLETWKNLTHPDDYNFCVSLLEQHVAGEIPVYEASIRMKHKSGEWVWINTRGRIFSRTQDGTAEWLLGTHYDISEQIKAESSLDEKSKQMQAIVQSMLDGVISIDNKGIILTFNRAAETIFGFDENEIFGESISSLVSIPNLHGTSNNLQNFIKRGQNSSNLRNQETNAVSKNGIIFPVELSIVEVEKGGEISFICIVRDITQSKKKEQEIHQLAFYDSLTLLPNRRLLTERLQNTLVHCSRENKFAALLFLDLDNFKNLNDSAGHNTGDLLLCQVASRLLKAVRQGDTVARLGGDEFVVVIESLSLKLRSAASQAEILAQKIITTLSQEYNLNGLIYNSSASMGVTLFNCAETSIEGLLKQADMAMYKAKELGRNGIQFFDPQMQVAVSKRAALINDLYEAIQQQQFSLYYQKQVDHKNVVIGVEALIRWNHPQKGIVSPAEFITLAEETGLIVPIGKWVLQQACTTLSQWQSLPKKALLTVAVNISVIQFSKEDFVDIVLKTLADSGVNPARLKLEITETLLANNIPDVKAKIETLKRHGITFSIDDFGTGYSSLSYLKQLPIDQLKIDQSFVREINSNPNDKAIAKAIITLAKSMELQVIAEGVETEIQRDILLAMGCRTYQGYFFGKPCAIKDLQV